MINSTVFLDTGFAIALLSPRDQYHAAALHWAAQIRQQGTQVAADEHFKQAGLIPLLLQA